MGIYDGIHQLIALSWSPLMFISSRAFLCALLLCAGTGSVTIAEENDSYADDKAAIAKAAAEYLTAVREGNAEKVAACWTAEGDFTDSTGLSQKGRLLARRATRSSEEVVVDVVPQVESIRFVTPDVALEDGTVEQSATSLIRYTAVWVRRDDRWQLDAVRQSASEAQTHYDHLRSLEWMIGDWQSEEGSPVRVSASCEWSRERNFLLREIHLATEAGDELTVTQRIGWDPLTEQVRVWSFDNAGGYSDGTWSREGNQWIVSTEGVTPEGSLAESRNVYTPINRDAFSVESHSVLDNAAQPDQKLQLVRKKK